MQLRNHKLWIPAIFAILIMSSGCATRGYVRSQVGASADQLNAAINDNRETLEKTGQDLANLETETRRQNEEITQTQNALETNLAEVEAEVGEVRTIATNSRALADSADDRSRDLARMFADRGQLEVTDSREIYFGFSRTEIDPEQGPALQAVAEQLRSDPNTILLLEGRTDSIGDPDFNTRLGQERVDATRGYLVLELGVPVHRIYGFSYGEARPDYDNESPEERGKNRSVKMLILGPSSETTLASLPE